MATRLPSLSQLVMKAHFEFLQAKHELELVPQCVCLDSYQLGTCNVESLSFLDFLEGSHSMIGEGGTWASTKWYPFHTGHSTQDCRLVAAQVPASKESSSSRS